MALFTPPVGTSVKTALNAETLDGHDSSEFAESNGIDGTEFKINKSNEDTFINLISRDNYPSAGNHFTRIHQNATKYVGESYINSELSLRALLDGTTYQSKLFMIVDNSETGRFSQSILNTEIDNTYLKLSDSSTYGYINITDESIVFNDGTSDVAEFATTGITIGDGHVPVYWGESASEPATYQPGNIWYDTSSTGELKMYVASTGWITIGTP